MTSLTKTNSRGVLLDPSFAIEWRDIADFLNEFGPYNGRYVPSFPSDWARRLKTHMEDLNLPPRKRLELMTKIAKEARLCTFPKDWAWDESKVWKENVGNLSVILGDSIVVGNALDPEPFHSWHDVVDDIRATRARSWIFKGSVSEYQELCMPLLQASPAAYLVDPYLDPFELNTELLLRGFFSKMKGSRCYSIEIIRRWPMRVLLTDGSEGRRDRLSIERELTQSYQDLVPKGCTFKIHCVVEPRGHDAQAEGALKLHDRFFLTKHGAINFGHGFRVLGKGSPLQNAFIVDAKPHVGLKRTYIEGVAHHKEQRSNWSGIPEAMDVVSFSVKG